MPTINYWNGTRWVAVSTTSGGGGVGPAGPAGPKGDKGEKGDPGRAVAVTVSASEPVAPLAGDVWIDNTTR